MRRHLIRLASASFICSRLATFGWVRFPFATRGKHNAEITKDGWELWSYFKPFVDQSSRHFRQCRRPLVLSKALFRLSVHVSFRKYSSLSLEVIEKRSKCKSIWPAHNFCGRDDSDFCTAVCYSDLPLKLALSWCLSKKVVFGPLFVWGRDTPDFGHAFSNYTYFRPCGRIWFSSVQRAQRFEGKNRGVYPP